MLDIINILIEILELVSTFYFVIMLLNLAFFAYVILTEGQTLQILNSYFES